MRNLCVVQARMSSNRFPGKVLAPFGDSTVLRVLLSRLSKSKLLDKVVVATSLKPSDDILVRHLPEHEIFRGDLLDVRSRFIELGKRHTPQNIIRITADCPLVCHDLVDSIIEIHESTGSDYTANCNVEPYPKGFDIEIFKSQVLQRSDFLTQDIYHKEHVTPWMYLNSKLHVTNMLFSDYQKARGMNYSVDSPSDLLFLNELESLHRVTNLTFNEIWKKVNLKS
jgi:spore coat polysaccharide biosynthesis protein SpsF (cytidylyltransferase family)